MRTRLLFASIGAFAMLSACGGEGRTSVGSVAADPPGGADAEDASPPPSTDGGVTSPAPAPRVVAGNRHTCARSRAGAVWCWGSNSVGQLGVEDPSAGEVPVMVRDLPPVESLSAGNSHTCAVTTAGAVYCWGWNKTGELGTGSSVERVFRPAPVVGLDGKARRLASGGGGHTCALMEDATVRCWGSNFHAELGLEGANESRTAVRVAGLANVRALGAGEGFTCAVTAEGTFCWGYNGEGMLGLPPTVEKSASPVRMAQLAETAFVELGGFGNACAVDRAGQVRCWGRNLDGQAARGTRGADFGFQPIESLAGCVSLSLGMFHGCAASGRGELRCWGRSESASHDGMPRPATILVTPTKVTEIPAVSVVVAGAIHTCAANETSVFCWGNVGTDQMPRTSHPTKVFDF